jgi:hypothetical protein
MIASMLGAPVGDAPWATTAANELAIAVATSTIKVKGEVLARPVVAVICLPSPARFASGCTPQDHGIAVATTEMHGIGDIA